jgi:hypothetical protein
VDGRAAPPVRRLTSQAANRLSPGSRRLLHLMGLHQRMPWRPCSPEPSPQQVTPVPSAVSRGRPSTLRDQADLWNLVPRAVILPGAGPMKCLIRKVACSDRHVFMLVAYVQIGRGSCLKQAKQVRERAALKRLVQTPPTTSISQAHQHRRGRGVSLSGGCKPGPNGCWLEPLAAEGPGTNGRTGRGTFGAAA